MPRSIIYGLLSTICVVTLAVIYIVKKTFTKEAILAIFLLDKKYFLLSFLCMFFYHTFDNLRLFILSKAVGIKYSFLYGYVISFINTFGATITPAHLGGEFVSLYTLARKGGRLHKVMEIVTMKTLTGLAFFVLAFPFMVYSVYQKPKQAIELFAILMLFLVGFSVFYVLLRAFLRNSKSSSPFWIRVKYTIKRYIVLTKLFLKHKKIYITIATISSILSIVHFGSTLFVKGFWRQC